MEKENPTRPCHVILPRSHPLLTEAFHRTPHINHVSRLWQSLTPDSQNGVHYSLLTECNNSDNNSIHIVKDLLPEFVQVCFGVKYILIIIWMIKLAVIKMFK